MRRAVPVVTRCCCTRQLSTSARVARSSPLANTVQKQPWFNAVRPDNEKIPSFRALDGHGNLYKEVTGVDQVHCNTSTDESCVDIPGVDIRGDASQDV